MTIQLQDIPDEVIDMVVQSVQVHHRSLRRSKQRLEATHEPVLAAQATRDLDTAHQAMSTFQAIQAERDMAKAS